MIGLELRRNKMNSRQQITHELAIDEVFIITTQRSFLSVHAAIKIPTEGLLLRGT